MAAGEQASFWLSAWSALAVMVSCGGQQAYFFDHRSNRTRLYHVAKITITRNVQPLLQDTAQWYDGLQSEYGARSTRLGLAGCAVVCVALGSLLPWGWIGHKLFMFLGVIGWSASLALATAGLCAVVVPIYCAQLAMQAGYGLASVSAMFPMLVVAGVVVGLLALRLWAFCGASKLWERTFSSA